MNNLFIKDLKMEKYKYMLWLHPDNKNLTPTLWLLKENQVVFSLKLYILCFMLLYTFYMYKLLLHITCICSSYLRYFFQWWHKVNITHNGQRMKHVDSLWSPVDTLLATWLIHASETKCSYCAVRFWLSDGCNSHREHEGVPLRVSSAPE